MPLIDETSDEPVSEASPPNQAATRLDHKETPRDHKATPSGQQDTPSKTERPTLRIRPLDVVIIVASAVALIALSVLVYGGPKAATLVVSTDTGEFIYPLSKNTTVSVDGPLGKTVISIQDGQATFIESPCLNKTCIAVPPIHVTGEWSACLPNAVFMRIEGPEATDETDAIVR